MHFGKVRKVYQMTGVVVFGERERDRQITDKWQYFYRVVFTRDPQWCQQALTRVAYRDKSRQTVQDNV